MYGVTFRLADSLPRLVLEAWFVERREVARAVDQMDGPLPPEVLRRIQTLFSERIENWLDAGHGACWLRQPAVAKTVSEALRFFDGSRYDLHAWCVMPNHVHVVVEPREGYALAALLHGWKSFTAKAANRLIGRTGEFWQVEYYDHLIRDADDYAHARRYLLENPVKAGLKNWPWVWSR